MINTKPIFSKICSLCNSSFDISDNRILYCNFCRHDNTFFCYICKKYSCKRYHLLINHFESCRINSNIIIEITPDETDLFVKVGKFYECLRCHISNDLTNTKKHIGKCDFGVIKYVDKHSDNWLSFTNTIRLFISSQRHNDINQHFKNIKKSLILNFNSLIQFSLL